MTKKPRLSMIKPRVSVLDTRTARAQSWQQSQKVVDPFYLTKEWRALRGEVVASAKGRCQRCGKPAQRFTADHIIERKDGGASLDRSNVWALGDCCNNKKTADAAAHRMLAATPKPEWLKPSRIPVTIVCGPPCSGKSSYVSQRAARSDLVLDLDVIASRLAGTALHDWGQEWLAPAMRDRNNLLGRLSEQDCRWPRAWLIVGEPTARARQWWQDKLSPESIVVLDVPTSTCVERLRADASRRRKFEQLYGAVHDWREAYTRRDGDLVITNQAGGV